MARITDLLSRYLPLLILLVSVGTYLTQAPLQTPSWIPGMLLGLVIFFAGLSLNVSSLKDIKNKKKELFIAVLLKWTLTVLVSIALALLFFSSNPEIAAGVILAGTVPSATVAVLYTFLAAGNSSLVVAASLLDVLISPIVTPLSLYAISSQNITISFWDLLQSFLYIVLLPLAAGLLVQRTFPMFIIYSKPVVKFASSLSIILIVFSIIGSGKSAIASQIQLLPLIALSAVIQVLLPMGASYYIAKKLSIAEADARAILFQVGSCNVVLAAILAYEFIGELAALAPIITMIINLSSGSFIASFFSKNTDSPVKAKTS
ncbi:bile acid:sodium symporter family protein [Mesobacillus harenae]|uniref:bile acid:sodium symporter family protein n=1 Tax=Mesobacillus harenae TaxID=2213203 RepID=UPI0015804EF5|nr:bile acid:sodium symporter [Mesobacillus harenae]